MNSFLSKYQKRVFTLFAACLLSFNISAQKQVSIEHLTVAEGLPENSVKSIVQDRYGFLWLATQNGLVKYDGYEFSVFQFDANDSTSISNNFITPIIEDSGGYIWAGSDVNGLNKYNRKTGKFTRYIHDPNDPSSLGHNSILTLYIDNENVLWIGTSGGLDKFEETTGTFTHYVHDSLNYSSISNNRIYSILEDSHGIFWIGTRDGLNILNRQTGKFKRFKNDPADPNSICGNFIGPIFEDSKNILWITSYNTGLNILSRADFSFKHYYIKKDEPVFNKIYSILETSEGKLLFATYGRGIFEFLRDVEKFRFYAPVSADWRSISSSFIFTLFEDRNEILWVGTFTSGLDKLDYHKNKFGKISASNENRQGLTSDFIISLCQDDKNIWIGTGYGLNRLDKSTGDIEKIYLSDYSSNSNTSNAAVGMCFEKSGNIWIASGKGLNKFNHATKKLKQYFHDPNDSRSISSDNVTCVLEDSKGYIWVTTRDGGLNRFDKSTGVFKHYFENRDNPNALFTNTLWSLFEDSKGNIWIGANLGGLHKYNPDQDNFIRYHDRDIGLQTVLNIFEDSKNRFWVGTYNGGLHLLDRNSGSIKSFYEKDGLPHNTIRGITEDANGFLWIGTDNGLAKFEQETKTFHNYDLDDGLQSMTFSHFASLAADNGILFFGGPKGLNFFDPAKIRDDSVPPSVVLTGFKIFQDPVKHGEDTPLREHINVAKEINLSYWQNDISIEYAGIHFRLPRRNTYAYRLENYEVDWRYVGTQRTATYTNLDPGEYVFHVKAANKDGIWDEEGTSILITITPPPWQTWYAYVIYILLLIGLYFSIRRYDIARLELKHKLHLKNAEADKLYELDQMKTRFFANVSHEFRTPLTLILGPLEKLIADDNKTDPRKQYKVIRRNAQRLLRLINQLLDISKIEAGGLRLEVSLGDLVKFLKPIVQSFNSLAERKGIIFDYNFPGEKIFTYFDKDKIEKIVYNLLSNAFKFTPAKGNVEFRINVASTDYLPANGGITRNGNAPLNEFVEIRVSDNGPGIKEENIDKIFDRFYQADDSQTRESDGTGIGLALTKELVEIHHGEIFVTSAEGSGTTFCVRLPLNDKLYTKNEIVEANNKKPQALNPEVDSFDETSPATQKKCVTKAGDAPPLVLIVEDNADLREFIRENIESGYQTAEAGNGEEGYNFAVEQIPDLIISDVMMPKIDGIKLCKMLKTDERSSHIPIILLTARASVETKLKGLETGADDYITKPFNADELKIRIKNLITQRNKLRERYKKQITLEPKEIAITSADEAFLQKVIDYIETNIADTNLSVESMGKEISMSRVQLYRKLNALTGQSASEFIRSYRIKRGAQLILQQKGTISEIAYSVGFNEPSYFTKCFKDHFGITPSQYTSGRKKK